MGYSRGGCVRELFEERNMGASSLCCGRGLPRRFRRGREPVGDLTAASARLLPPLLPVHFWPYQLSRLLPRLLTRDCCARSTLLSHVQGHLESRYWFRSREDAALARVAVRFPCTQ
jgi:hypothetical protein